MNVSVIASGVLLGCVLFVLLRDRSQSYSIDDGGVIDTAADFLETWDMTNAEALNNPNVRAFLQLIRKGEGTADDGGYRRIVGGGSFASFADHPRQSVWLSRLGIYSTAAGAYQILARTWDMVRLQAGVSDFSPTSQDIAAVQLIRNRGALADVLAGRISTALQKCSWEWASLPPWRYSKQGTLTMDAALTAFANYGGRAYV